MAKKKVATKGTTKKSATTKTTKKVATKAAKTTTKTPAKAASSGRGTGINQKLNASKELQAVVKQKTISRGEMMKAVWAYIKKHDLQNPENKREIMPDATLGAVIGKKKINMFKMTAALSKHLS